MNVAFEGVSKNGLKVQIDYEVPDRKSAKSTLKELELICPNRKWNLVEINVTREELQEYLKSTICNLVAPLNSILDEDLGAAFWFASRGIGLLNGVEYSSPCRVLLYGSGADELFGGYTRHRNVFARRGDKSIQDCYTDLGKELDFDWERLPTRNLARDDRVICDHGLTGRSPYVQEDFTAFVRYLRPSQLFCHTLEQGKGDKLLLRLSGYLLGLRNSSVLKKKALQFGSKIANSKQNAKDASMYLTN